MRIQIIFYVELLLSSDSESTLSKFFPKSLESEHVSPVRDRDSPAFEVQCSIFLSTHPQQAINSSGCLVNLPVHRDLFSLLPSPPTRHWHSETLSHSTMELEYCESDNSDACGGVFPYKTSVGLCAKCKKLADLEPNSTEYQLWKVTL
jgi:hypothetical protein